MACPLCGAVGAGERKLEDEGYISVARATQISGHSRSWVENRLANGRLTPRTRDNRTVVSVRELHGLMAISGPPGMNEQAQMLREAGNSQEAVWLESQMQAELNSRSGMPRSEQSSPPVLDPLEQYARLVNRSN